VYSDESDGVDHNTDTSFPFYPVPDEAITNGGWIEEGPPGNVDHRDSSDRHILIVDSTNNHLYELYNMWFNGTGWVGGSGAFFDMNTNNRRPEGWTSADAGGLAIVPGLVRYDEVYGPAREICHAFRVTVRDTNDYYVWPASHVAGSNTSALPMGSRLRLKASKYISSYAPEVQKIFRAFKTYGLIVADNGSDMYISGTYDTRWNNDVLNPAFGSLKASDFEVIQLGWKPPTFLFTVPANTGSGDPATATLTAYDASYNVATGYTGTVHFTSSDGAATLPVDYTFTPSDAGTHTFASGLILRTAGGQTVTATDTANATITSTRPVMVGPPAPTGLNAAATSTTQIGLTWNASTGATQYEVWRASAGSPYSLQTTTPSTAFSQTVAAGATYVYKVRALNSAAGMSGFSTPDAATTLSFTDDPIVPGTTPIRAVHITQLREAVNAMRAAAGLTAASFSDGTLTSVPARTIHIEELRAALIEARGTLGLPAVSFTDPVLTAGSTVIKATHVEQLRAAVK
jgi:hypothetical protein